MRSRHGRKRSATPAMSELGQPMQSVADSSGHAPATNHAPAPRLKRWSACEGQTRLKRFGIRHGIRPSRWAATAGMPRPSFERTAGGTDAHLATIRAIVRAAAEILQRPVDPGEVFDIGDDAPIPAQPFPRETVSGAHRRTLKRYSSRLDRILRGENIPPSEFAKHAGITRQMLLRYRMGEEPALSTLVKIVVALRQMTGKAYTARHLYDLGDGLEEMPSRSKYSSP